MDWLTNSRFRIRKYLRKSWRYAYRKLDIHISLDVKPTRKLEKPNILAFHK